MYKVHYDKKTGEVLGFYDHTGVIEYPGGIPEPNIEITTEQHAEAFEAGKVAKISKGKFIVEELPEPTLEEKQEQWKTSLKSQYDAERVRLGSLLLMADDDEEETDIKAQRVDLKTKYDADLLKIEQGINPFEETE